MNQRPSCSVLLFGGLGNQLFQIAAGLHNANGQRLLLDTSFIDRNKEKNWFTDHDEFAEIDEIVIDNVRSLNWISKKLIGLGIRSSSIELTLNKKTGTLVTLRKILSVLLSKIVFKNSKVYIANGIGFDSELPTDSILIGYFQSYKWIYSDASILTAIRELIRCGSDQSRSSAEVLLQVRLGDFESTAGFQVIDESYVKKAISHISNSVEIKSIMVYSDDSTRAKNLLRNWRDIEITYDESGQLHPLSTLENMATYQNHIISSSTFGIWAAILAQKSQNVIAPTPWFSKSVEPRFLLPPSWFRVER